MLLTKLYNRLNRDNHERLVHIEDKLNEIMHNNYYTRSYAQRGEDVVIYELFKIMGITHPTYLDIGVHHPYEISNTALMHEKGCHGINIEANPNLFEAFTKERPNDINICCGVGKEEGEMPFYMIDERSGRNSFIKENVEKFINKNPEFKIKEIRQIKIDTLSNILEKFGGGVKPDYMTIDIEGLEYDVLSNFDLETKGAKIITIEVMKGNKDMKVKFDKLFSDAGYFLYMKVGSNYTWIRNEYHDVIFEV